MNPQKIIKQNQESIDSLTKGVNLACDIVKQTLGPKGRNVIFADYYNSPYITNDGVSILKQIYSDDETEQLAIDVIKQSAMRTNMLAGDASTTFVTLAQAIFQEGLKSSKHPMEVRDEINYQSTLVIDALKTSAKPVETFDEIKKVASISAESEQIGALIAEAQLKVGKEGQVNVQESEISGVRVEYTNGLEIDEGYIAEFMMNNERGEAVINNPYILIIDSKLSNIKDILPIMQKIVDNGATEVLVLCDGMDGNMIPTIALNKRAKVMEGKNVMEVFGVKFPAIKKNEFIEDIALVTQGKVMGMGTGLFPDKAVLADLGRCEKVIITAKKTVFIGGKGDVTEKIATLKAQRDASETGKDAFDERIARLKGEVAVIKVGAGTQAELQYIKDKIDDAVYATKGAVQEGAVRGGGIALKMIALDLPDGILKQALQSPYNQIQENAGGNFKIDESVMDSVKATRYAVQNAVSCVGSLLTVVASVATRKVKPKND